MAGAAAQLIACLQQERDAYQQLLTLSAQKEPVLVKGDVASLEELTRKELDVLESLRAMEKCRAKEADALAQHYGIAEQPVKLRALADAAPLEDRLKMQLISRQLEQVLDELADLNKKNKKLIDIQLRYSNSFIDALTGEGAAATTYNGSGNVRPKQNNRIGLINQKA